MSSSSSHAKRKTNPPIRQSNPVLLSEINSRSTCITLNIPYSRRKTKTPIRRSIPILLSDIHSYSTCIALKTPYYIAYRNCKPQLDPLRNTRKKSKTEQQKYDNRQCKRYWLPLM